MIKKTYALFDTATSSFHNPVHCLNDGDAIRLFTTFVNPQEGEQPTNVSKYPQHFSIWYVGDFDDKTGRYGTFDEKTQTFTDKSQPRELIAGNSVKQEANQNFTVKELITMLKMELGQENIVQVSDYASKEN
jgi:putative alpha-1,2-mannosidase